MTRAVDGPSDPDHGGLGGGIAGAAGIVVASILISRLLGFLRQVAITAQFGVGAQADAWFAAFRIPDAIFTLLAGGALLSAVIPVYAEVRARNDPKALRELVIGIARLVLLGTALAAGLGALLAGPLMRAIAPGFPETTLTLATDSARWLMISPVLLGLSALAKAVLQAQRRFALPALSPIVYNLGIIFGAVVLAQAFGLAGLVWGTLIGAGLHLGVQLPGLRRRRTPSPQPSPSGRGGLGSHPSASGRGMVLLAALGLGNADVRRVIRLMLPRLFGVAVLQLSLIYVNILASLQGESAVAALNNAFILMLLPLGVFAMSLGEAALPELAERWARREHGIFAARLTGVTRHVLFLNIPASVGLFILAGPIVVVLFQRGAFDVRATELTAAALQFYAIGLAGHAAVEVQVRGFFAMHDTRTPVLIGVASLALHMVLSWLMAQWLGQSGIALGVSIGVLVEALWLGAVLARRGGLTLARPQARSLGVTIAATLGMGLVVAVLRAVTWTDGAPALGSAGLLFGYLAAALLTYVAIARLLRSAELEELSGRLLSRGRPRVLR